MAFDYQKYQFALCGTIAHMDEFHIQMLFIACRMVAKGGSGVAVEIGSYRGASTAALIEAVNLGYLTHLHIVEVKPNASLRQVIALCDFPDRVTLHTKPSWELELPHVDFVFIDGDHKWPAVGDALRSLTWGARVICLHDTCCLHLYPDTWGSNLVARILRTAVGRKNFEDRKFRKGMNTHRGFLVSVENGMDLSELEKYRGVPPEMDSVVLLHPGGLPLARILSPVWRSVSRRVVAIVSPDCPTCLPWADWVHVWHAEVGRKGFEHCRRLLEAIRYASEMEGPTAIMEHDSMVCAPFPVRNGVLYGSEVFNAQKNRKGVKSPLATRSAFCPWVADRETWIKIRSVVERWISAGHIPDSGYADRVISAAAQTAGIELEGIGFNRWPALTEEDEAALVVLFEQRECLLLHGLKNLDMAVRMVGRVPRAI